MKVRQRRVTSTPLLLATSGLTITLMGCSVIEPEVTGNLMPPPMVELCIEVEPKMAQVTVRGVPVSSGKCVEMFSTLVQVEATAEGYEPYKENLDVLAADKKMNHAIRLIPISQKEVTDPEEMGSKKEQEKPAEALKEQKDIK